MVRWRLIRPSDFSYLRSNLAVPLKICYRMPDQVRATKEENTAIDGECDRRIQPCIRRRRARRNEVRCFNRAIDRRDCGARIGQKRANKCAIRREGIG
jgi:hypothetical protein